MPAADPTQLEKLRTRRQMLMYISLTCALLASGALLMSSFLKPDPDLLDEQLSATYEKITKLSARMTKLEGQVQQAEKERDLNDQEREQMKTHVEEIGDEIESIDSEMDSLVNQAATTDNVSPTQKKLIVAGVVLVGLQIVFFVASVTISRGVSINPTK
jgi:septal ring factor EnvC (AmiA/AmiB activator)